MTERDFKYLTRICDNIRIELMKIQEKDYFLMAMSCMIDNWSKAFKCDPGEIALEICQIIHMKEEKDAVH